MSSQLMPPEIQNSGRATRRATKRAAIPKSHLDKSLGRSILIRWHSTPSWESVGETSPLHSSTRHNYEPECFRLRLHRITQFTIKNKMIKGDSQKRIAATMVSHPPCSSTANIGLFYEVRRLNPTPRPAATCSRREYHRGLRPRTQNTAAHSASSFRH